MRRHLVATLAILATSLILPSGALATNGIAGTVSAPSGVEEVEVCIVEPLPSETCTYPDAGGSYQLLGIDPGTYQVEFLPSYGSHLVAQYYNLKARLSEANKITVSPNLVKVGIDAVLELGGEIEGSATDALTAAGVEEVEVCAQTPIIGTAVSCAHTDSNGHYQLPSLPSGSYRVGFWGKGRSAAYAPQYYLGQSTFSEGTIIQIDAGETINGVDAALHTGASVRGTVTADTSSDPLDGIAVCLLKTSATGPERCVYTDAAGGYDIAGLATGTYQVVFSPEFSEFSTAEFFLPEEDGWRTQYYGGAPQRAGAESLSLSVPETRTQVDAALISTTVPRPPPSPPPAPNTAVAAPPVLPLPSEPAKKCRHGFVKRRVKGHAKCVKAHKKRKHKGHRGARAGSLLAT